MPHARADPYKRDVAQGWYHLQGTILKMIELNELFNSYHPELANAFRTVAEMSLAGQELLMKVWEQAWGKRPSNLDSWRGEKSARQEGDNDA